MASYKKFSDNNKSNILKISYRIIQTEKSSIFQFFSGNEGSGNYDITYW